MKPTLPQALELARAGDERGYSAIYAELAAAVTRFAHSRRVEDPEGLTNEVFLAAFRGLDSFEGDDDKLRGWIFTIARNKAIDDSRRRGRRPALADVETPEEPSAGADVEAFDRLQTEWVADRLAGLTDDQRDVLMLRLVAGLTVAEVAEVLDREIGAVKALQRRGIRRLQREHERGDHGEDRSPDPYPSGAGER